MIDPLLSLAMSMHANPGVYALLLGSGVSRSAGIPTGWEVVEDLIRRIAALEREGCEPDPAAWYARKYGQDPGYSDLLDAVAKSPTERSQLLRGYFEPADDEKGQGLKVPTAAHHAIAGLVASGSVRIIVTTNFDRLLEQALEAANVTPTVISTPDAAEGALPLMHGQCTIMKVHGDYLDTRIKNTPEELAEYDERIDALLDRVFDECGLVVCGWSAEWDTALRAAIERCKSRRFSTYWTVRGELGETARQLVKLRAGQAVVISGADAFFADLAEKVEALRGLDQPHPISAKIAVARAKKYLAEPKYNIELHDMLMREIERIVQEVESDRYPVHAKFEDQQVAARAAAFEALSTVAVSVMASGCFWAGDQHITLWCKALARLANRTRPNVYDRRMLGLRYYPAAIMLYAGGIVAVAENRYGLLHALLTTPRVRIADEERPLAVGLYVNNLHHAVSFMPGLRRNKAPLSARLYDLLREPLREFMPDDGVFERAFDRFEYIQALATADLNERSWTHPGAFVWRNVDFDTWIGTEIEEEAQALGQEWPVFRAGFFGGSLDRFEAAKKYVNAKVQEAQFR